ncbi:MAG: tail fiber domain-containing protein [Phycisphaerae bacterium]|jgi:hypothetical protein
MAGFPCLRGPLDGALEVGEKLRAVRFDRRADQFPDRCFPRQRQIGLIAQEVRRVAPEIVQQGGDGCLSVDYGRLTPLLIEAVKELRLEYLELKSRLNRLEGRIETLRAGNRNLSEPSSSLEPATTARLPVQPQSGMEARSTCR